MASGTLSLVLIAAPLVAALAGCGDSGPARDRQGAAASVASDRPATVAGERQATLCTLLTAQEIVEAFAGKIPVVVKSGTATRCEYSMPGYEAGQILVQRMSGHTYDGRKRAYQLGSIKPVPVDGLGQDAYTLNDAQIDVRVNDQVAITLGVMLLVQGPPPLTREESRAAVIALATTVVGRL